MRRRRPRRPSASRESGAEDRQGPPLRRGSGKAQAAWFGPWAVITPALLNYPYVICGAGPSPCGGPAPVEPRYESLGRQGGAPPVARLSRRTAYLSLSSVAIMGAA